MIVANALKNAFNGKTLTYYEYSDEVTKGAQVTKDIQFFWGDQKELNKWVSGRANVEKYPLIWYVLAPYNRPLFTDFAEVNVRLILFTSTQQSYYNNTRSLINYTEILNPLALIVENTIIGNARDFEFSDKNIGISDVPNYGVDVDREGVNGDFSSTGVKGTQSITLDYLDAKVMDLKIRVKQNNCNN